MTNIISEESFFPKPVEVLLSGVKGKYYPYPANMSGNFAVRNSTDFQDAKVFAEVTSGERVLLAEFQCNSVARQSIELLIEHFRVHRELLAEQKLKDREGRDSLNSYERRQEERRDRYEDIAIAKRRASAAAFDASHNAVAHIPFGQPILVGHHSEKRHRAVLSRSHNLMDRACNLAKTADYYDNKAEKIGNSGISSDDPDAVLKLNDKVVMLKKAHQMMLSANKIVRNKASSDDEKKEKLFCLGYSEKMVIEIMSTDYSRQGFASYQLSLSNKAIKTAEERIAAINKAKTLNTDEQEFKGFTVQCDTEDNRIVIRFPDKPDDAVRALLKRNAFKYSRSRNHAWVRKITPNALSGLKYIINNLETLF